ncbi:MAG TPA: Hsp20 family protein [Terriglobia bacterium]|nr:Hsp20 family protein [Terriglobia bacterium]
MQAHRSLIFELPAASPVKVISSQDPLDDQRLFKLLVTSCAYQLYVRRSCQGGHALDDWLDAETMVRNSAGWCPIGFIDLNNVVDVEASVGDFKAEDLEVWVDPNQLIISGDLGRTERAHGRARIAVEPQPIFKLLRLPVGVDPSRVTAELKCGMLRVVLPKIAAPAKPRARAKAA